MNHSESTPSETVGRGMEECWQKLLKRAENLFSYQDKDKWFKNMRESLSLMASIIATLTFQLATNPPGGVLQANYTEIANITNCATSHKPCPGEAVLALTYKKTYLAFLICNTITFVASLSVCLLLISGISLNHRFAIWFLSIGMCFTITGLALTYMFAASMVTPDAIWNLANGMFDVFFYIWIALLVMVGLFLILRLFFRGNKRIQQRNSSNTEDRATSF